MSASTRSVHRVVIGAHLTLLAVVIAWRIGVQPTLPNLGWALFLCVPLMLPVHGLWQGKRYTHAWATLCVIPYFVVGITEAVANPAQRIWAGLCLAISLVLFAALIVYLRVTADEKTN